MKDHSRAWAEALAFLGYPSDKDDSSQKYIKDIKNLERRPTVRRSRGYRLLELATNGDTDGPLAWLLRYALGRAIADVIVPRQDPSFSLGAALAALGELGGSPLEVLSQSESATSIGGLLLQDTEGSWTISNHLASWVIHGTLVLPESPSVPSPTSFDEDAIDELGLRLAGLMKEHAPPMFVLTGADPMLALATATVASGLQHRPVRCWAVPLDEHWVTGAIVALRWVGAVEGFDPMIIPRRYMFEALTGGHDIKPDGIPARPAGVTLWVAAPEVEPRAPWLAYCRATVDLTPLLSRVRPPRPAATLPARPRGLRRPSHGSLHPSARTAGCDAIPVMEYTTADRLARLDPFQRAAFPDETERPHTRAIELAPEEGEPEPHLAPTNWQNPERSLEHLVLNDEQRGALQRAAARIQRGERCVVLLHGPSGTGKTQAAHCLAGSADLPVYQLLPHLVRDTFYGEQDRKVAELFNALQRRPAVLVIDEADAWLGRREGSAAGQGGASLSECSSMLQELERYQGAAVLTTNRLSTMDVALHRRVDLILHLALPELTERMALWASLLEGRRQLRADELCLLASVPLTGGDIDAIIREAELMHENVSVAQLLPVARRRARRASLLG